MARLLVGDTDDERLADLLWGLILLRGAHGSAGGLPAAEPPALPRAYALLKLLFLPDPLDVSRTFVNVRPEPAVVNLLTSGRVGEACRIAARRLRAAGLVPMPHTRGKPGARDDDWEQAAHTGVDGHRLAAALLVPVAPSATATLRRLVLREAPASEPIRKGEV